ncbi:MAG TPA: pyridoxamine 5'-phosphate oxidase family protein [Terracidiphilus sp.]
MSAEVTELRGREGLERIGELIADIRFAMLTTVAADGSLDSRPMATQKAQFDGTLWFLTSSDSRKASEIAENAQVCVAYADPDDAKYVSLKGRANVSEDRAKIHELWSPAYKAWFPEGEDDSQIRVLRVDVTEGEFWDATDGKVVRSVKYLAAAAGASVKMGEHGSVSL